MTTRRRLVTGLLLFLVAGFCGLPAPAAEPLATPVVSLTIDFGDGFQKIYSALPHKPEMTVLDALKAAAAHRHALAFKHTGSGATAMLRSIDGLANEGGAGEGRNWQLWVNDAYATRGMGALILAPGDRVLWRFDIFRPAE